MSPIKGFLDLAEVASRLGKSYPQVAKYVRDGLLPFRQFGPMKLVPTSALKGFKPPAMGRPKKISEDLLKSQS